MKQLLVLYITFIFSSSLICQSEVVDTILLYQTHFVHFDHDKDQISAYGIPILERYNDVQDTHKIWVTGHTDADGSDEYNIDLSRRRVQKVANFLTDEMNVPFEKLEINFRGEFSPIANNISEAGKSINRRVSISKGFRTKARLIKGKVVSIDGVDINNGIVYYQTKNYYDSTLVDKNGEFKFWVADGAYVRIEAASKEHFFNRKILKADNEVSEHKVIMNLPKLKSGQRYNLPDLYFKPGKDVLLFRSYSSLRSLNYSLLNSNVCAIVEGHVNKPNSKPQLANSYYYDLSVKRAQKIYTILVGSGVEQNRLNPIGYSNCFMIASNL